MVTRSSSGRARARPSRSRRTRRRTRRCCGRSGCSGTRSASAGRSSAGGWPPRRGPSAARPAPSDRKKRWAPVSPSITGGLGAVERDQVGLQRDAEPAEVADVLADGERAVDVVARAACAGASASYCSISAAVRSSNAARSASVHQSREAAVAVVLGALVVEAVADLVADDRADRRRSWPRRRASASKNGGCRIAAGNTISFIAGVVVGVDRLRRHEPLVAVDRLAELAELAVDARTACARADVADAGRRRRSRAPSSRATSPGSRSSA